MSLENPTRVSGSVFTKSRKRGEVWYAKWRVDGKQFKRVIGPVWTQRGRPESGTYTRKMAEAVLQAWMTDARRGAVQDLMGRDTVTLQAAVEAWLDYVEHERGRSPSTTREYRRAANGHFLPSLGANTRVDKLTARDLDRLRRELLLNPALSPATARKIMSLVYACLKHAKRRGWCAANVADDVERVTVRRSGEFQVLSVDEVRAVIRHAKTPRDAAMFALAAFTGLRMGELRALRWRDIEFATSTVHVRTNIARRTEGTPKSGKVRAVPLIDEVAALLDGLSRRELFTEPHDRVFAAPRGGHLKDDDVRKLFYTALGEAGLGHKRLGDRPLRFHDLRHTFGTLAVKAWDLPTVQGYMGHADISTTMGYVHHIPKHKHAAQLTALVQQLDPQEQSPRAAGPLEG